VERVPIVKKKEFNEMKILQNANLMAAIGS